MMEILWQKIEYLRKKMHLVALEKGIAHPDVLIVSQRLDQVINELYRVTFLERVG